MSALPAYHFTGAQPIFDLTDRLRKAREYSGLNQHQLAAAMGVSRNTISNAERGTHKIDARTVIAWAYYTGTDLGWLTEEGQQPVKCTPRDSNPEPSGSDLDDAFAQVGATSGATVLRVRFGAFGR